MKLFELTIDDLMLDEVFAISLVEEPAIESNFVWFDKEKVQFQKIDTEKRIVVGPVLIPNKKIFRVDGEGQGYEVFFKPETVEKLAQNYLKKGYQGEATLEHEKKVKGVTLVESWLKTSKLDKSNSYGLNLPLGTWVGAFKIDNDKIWNDFVKSGEVKGFSIEGMFTHDLVKASKVTLDSIMNDETDYLLSQIRAIIKKDKRYSKGKRVEMESYSDYPESVSNNAKKGIKLNESEGNKCATQVGKVRAQQLAKKEAISLQTIKRMYSFLSRAQEYYDEGDTKSCGYISYMLWGGLSAKRWSMSKLKELGEMKFKSMIIDEDYAIIDDRLAYATQEQAEQASKDLGCSGYHTHEYMGQTWYMSCETHKLAEPTISSSYPGESNTKVTGSINLEDGPSLDEAIAAVEDAINLEKPIEDLTLEEAKEILNIIHSLVMPMGGSMEDRRVDLITPNPCTEGYIAYGTKIKNGREVPNCIPVK